MQTLNTFRSQCGLPLLSQNTMLDTAAMAFPNSGGPASQIKVAADAGYSMASNAGAVFGRTAKRPRSSGPFFMCYDPKSSLCEPSLANRKMSASGLR